MDDNLIKQVVVLNNDDEQSVMAALVMSAAIAATSSLSEIIQDSLVFDRKVQRQSQPD